MIREAAPEAGKAQAGDLEAGEDGQGSPGPRWRTTSIAALVGLVVMALGGATALAQSQVISGNLTVQGSQCLGIDCPSSSTFGFDTLRLQENNLRINFNDTSATASFPDNDWSLVANDTANGGTDRFSIEDITAGRIPFTVEAGARQYALYLDSNRAGFGTNNPVTELHTVDGDSPTLRLEQNNSSGFTPQTWDVAGNEANFFIRDVSNGSRLPFKIRPGAATDAFVIHGNGDIGMGTGAAPTGALDIKRNDGTAKLKIRDEGAGAQVMMELENNGPIWQRMSDTSNGTNWQTGLRNNGFLFHSPVGVNPPRFTLDPNGNVTITGQLFAGSDVKTKKAIEPVDNSSILDRVAKLPISEWQYKDDENGWRHIGPMAQDFYEAFRLGKNRRTVAPTDLSGVSLAAVQELMAQNERLEKRIIALEKQARK